MDNEEQNNEQQQKQNAVKNSAKNLFKNIIKKFIKKHLSFKAICIILIIIMIIAALAWLITNVSDAIFDSDSAYSPQDYFSNIYIADDGTLVNGRSVEDMWENEPRYRRYLSSMDSLSYLLNAQIVSQYPYISSADHSKLNGIVKFYRNDAEKPMTYVTEETFDSLVSSCNEHFSAENYAKALSSFAITDGGSIKVAYQTGDITSFVTEDVMNALWIASGTGRYIDNIDEDGNKYYSGAINNRLVLETTTLSYRELVEKYSLPFELLWAIVVTANDGRTSGGSSEDFAHAIASMAYDGEINLIINDCDAQYSSIKDAGYDLVTYETFSDIVLKKNGREVERIEDPIDQKISSRYYSTKGTILESRSAPLLKVKDIRCWSAQYGEEFPSPTGYGILSTDDNNSGTSHSLWEYLTTEHCSSKYEDCKLDFIKGQFSTEIDENEVDKYKIEFEYDIRSRKENMINETRAERNLSSSGSITTELNYDLIRLFNVIAFSDVKEYLTVTHYDDFINAVEANQSTANMVDLINYILNVVTDTDDYGEDIDYETAFSQVSYSYANSSGTTTLSGDTIQERVWLALRNAGFGEIATAGVMGNIEGESGFDPGVVEGGSGVGFGLCQWSYDRRTALESYATSKGKSPSNEDIQIEFLLAELTPGGGANGYATYQFSGYEDQKNIWTTSSDIAEATTAFCAGFERPSIPRNETRIEAANRYYNQFHGATLGNSSGGNGSTESSNTPGIRGYYTSLVSGKKFTLYSQNIEGSPWYWECGCFVTSQATIASGYGSNLTPNQFTGWMGMGLVSDFETKCGCRYKRESSISANTMKQYLKEGKAIMIELLNKNLKTENGTSFYSQHYVSVIDYKQENGVDKVYIHDPWSTSPSYGWANINDIVSVSTCFDSVWK